MAYASPSMSATGRFGIQRFTRYSLKPNIEFLKATEAGRGTNFGNPN